MTNKQGRCVVEIMTKILDIIPEEEVSFRDDIKIYMKSLWNVSPELRRSADYWIPLQNILVNNFTEINEGEDWKMTSIKIFNNTQD